MKYPSVFPVFPHLIHCFEIEDFKKIQDQFIDCCYEEENKDPMGVLVSNEGGWQSHDFYTNKSDLRDNFIVTTLCEHIDNYFSNSTIFRSNFESQVVAMWLNINREGNLNHKHIHPGADMSGVFYIKIPDDCDCGGLEFSSPNFYIDYKSMKILKEDVNKEHNHFAAYEFLPQEGMGYIFPGHMMHGVKSNKSRQDRISVAFNILLNSKT